VSKGQQHLATISRQEIVQIAEARAFYVSRYSWSHSRLRKVTRRMMKDGLLTLVASPKDGFYYRTPEAAEREAKKQFTLQSDPVVL
jgi:hypothetical protein